MIENFSQTEYNNMRELVQRPDWYLEFGKMRQTRLLGLGAVQAAFSGNIREAAARAKGQVVDMFEELLEKHEVRLGIPGQDELDDQDEERQPIDRIVIHHSSRAEGITLGSLNALHLLQLYVPVYQSEAKPVLNSQGEHQPIYSGHFNEKGEQVFYGYHWKVQQDGEPLRLLNDSEIGWHAGNWDMNKRSVGICIDDDLEHKRPTDEALEGVARVIAEHYPYVEPSTDTIIGHNEASGPTMCPGDKFLSGWKFDLLAQIGKQ